jgi:hypothetical protein
MNINRFSILAEMRRYIKDMRPLPSVATLKQDVQGLMGIVPEYTEMLQQQVDVVDRAVSDFESISSNIADMKQAIDAEYNEILAYLSSSKHFIDNLAISRNVREHWVLYPSVMENIMVEASMIQDQWKYPAACINAQHYDLIDTLLAFELLYLIDTDKTVLSKQQKAIDDGGSNRLKHHSVQDFESLDFASETSVVSDMKFGVPLGQMAMVVAPNIFERITPEVSKTVLGQIKTLLRPGGRLVFNLFDAESPTVAQMMVDGVCSGYTQEQMATIATESGLVVQSWRRVLADNFIIVVLTMPGELHSVKVKSSTGFRRRS